MTGEFFQSHQLAIYQSQGVLNGIDLQYSSLQADPYPDLHGVSDHGDGLEFVLRHLDQGVADRQRRLRRAAPSPTTTSR